MKNKHPVLKILFPILIFGLYFIMDIFDFPSIIGINKGTLNLSLLNIMVESTIVIVLYLISYYYVDNKENEKKINSKNTAVISLIKIYKECDYLLQLLDNKYVVKQYVVPKVDFDSKNDIIINNFKNNPFSLSNTILELSINGFITKEELNQYLFIKQEYQYLANAKIIFFDLENPQNESQRILYDDLNKRDRILKETIKNEILKLEKLL